MRRFGRKAATILGRIGFPVDDVPAHTQSLNIIIRCSSGRVKINFARLDISSTDPICVSSQTLLGQYFDSLAPGFPDLT